MPVKFSSFKEFYPFYLREHQNPWCRLLHFLGTSGAIIFLVYALLFLGPRWALLSLAIGYGPAWIGHFGFEKNRPATFKYPLYSFRGDFLMFWHILTGKLRIFT